MKTRAPHDGVYARIGPSRIHGVGVRAIRDIPAGTLVFAGESERVAWVSRAAVRRMPRAVRALYEDFGMVADDRIGVPPSLNMLSVGWYVNHADRPNVEAGDDGRFRALRRGAVLTLDDVSELARAQRVLAWGEMARQVAHEIKNPLTPMRLGMQHLRRARRDGRVDFDEVLDQNVERMLAEIDRLDEIARAFSRYGTVPEELPAPADVDVAAIVLDVVRLEQLGAGDVEWTVDGAGAPVVALAREPELREVLLNVLENARHAGSHRVRVAVAKAEGSVRLVVRDDGHGIAADVLPRIFEPHFSTRTSGSGLGLAISRRMIEGWGGGIDVVSTAGEGTAVTIRLVSRASS